MRNMLRIARWEFRNRVRTRSYLFNTFISPLIFTMLFLLPLYFTTHQPDTSVKLIGVIDLSPEKNIANKLSNALNRSYKLENTLSQYGIYTISIKNAPAYRELSSELKDIEAQYDSLNRLHNRIKQERTAYFTQKATPNRQFSLNRSYERLRKVREEKELVSIELQRYRTAMDSLYAREARVVADSMIINNVLSAYLLFPSDFIKSGRIEYHSRSTADLLDSERLEKTLQNLIIRSRLQELNLGTRKVRELMRPVHLDKYKIRGNNEESWNIYAQFYGPLIGVFLLFIAIFTSGGYLFSGMMMEKANRILEVLLSYAAPGEIMGGKILGLGTVGLTQVLIWLFITFLLNSGGIISGGSLSYLTFENALYFLLYFSLGYLFFGAIFIMFSSIFSNEYDAQQVNQLLRIVAIFPVLLSLLVVINPNSFWIRLLSYVPFLTPSFMILRIPLSGQPLTTDIIITTGIMLFSIAVIIWISGRLFRVTTLMMGKKPSWSEIIYWIRHSK
ncbi:MAG TPA: ABC transporter permease [Caldithrix abyssi]|uniref:ABC transporter permease n=1 Tax=Caldithrix abyssi TaxID=187145 RepID=A0A7V1PVD5_CALAY|nr:ABC transporter permease [Caldithrix abyssi]